MNLLKKLVVEPGSKVKLKKLATDETFGILKEEAEGVQVKQTKKLASLHELLYAEHKRSLLIVLQAMDAGGKDGTIKHVMSGVNPQGCSVTSFKQPSTKELDHDFLWRIHAACPAKGDMGIFNRSHYEDVLVVRVHKLISKEVCKQRYAEINNFEKMLTANGTHILKFFLHISADEQKRRFDARLNDPEKNWKFSPADYKEREYWDAYQSAFEDALENCTTEDAPWFVIPSDHKWFRDHAISDILIRTLESFQMEFPKVDPAAIAKTRSGGKKAAPTE